MSLEGRLRDLGLPEVCQLLGSSRKSGTLRVQSPLQARAAEVRFVQGMIADAAQWAIDLTLADEVPEHPTPLLADTRAVEAVVLDLLTWREGDFRFVAEKVGARSASPIRLSVESMLVEAAQRSEVWDRVQDRVPSAHVVPAFVDIDPQQLPHLRLAPQEWEVLTRVDGLRDLKELAEVLNRQLLDVAQIVHTLIGAGVLTLRDSSVAPRKHPTPPAHQAVDMWVPSAEELSGGDSDDDDLVFDPIALGVVDHDGLPARHTPVAQFSSVEESAFGAPLETDVIEATSRLLQTASTLEFPNENAVASATPKQSLSQREASWPAPDMDAASLCEHGDTSARSGDLAGALTWWSAALRTDAAAVDADRIREAIALAARLHALLHPARRS